jgi:hypothetical protein
MQATAISNQLSARGVHTRSAAVIAQSLQLSVGVRLAVPFTVSGEGRARQAVPLRLRKTTQPDGADIGI